jgi:CBS domain-containing protein
MQTIGQVMNRRVNAIHADATVAEAIEFLTQNHTAGAPVVNGDGELVGTVSELELIDVVFDSAIKEQPITEYMTRRVHAARPDESLSRAAQLFALYAFRRLPVVENGKLVGILTRRDLINHVLKTGNHLTDPLAGLVPSVVPAGCVEDLIPN